ncbi:hypothetical protein [Campylobacter cuniculorum]|uniref:Uncharacterized protein n=2 Tax=Campylobacter cuniculorum TaxID=374106 RepID=A0A1W6BYW2_9BACT|nr:hypothetical protein [Campylobacter cuniculorum]ARJ57262.1 hypothetical protein CCUN_1687 [Campylobacter cuniculorum DSM 23162 = LMG 24588]QOR04698.1 hypothetical protein A0071_01760 [Campylobacter cuniculorum]
METYVLSSNLFAFCRNRCWICWICGGDKAHIVETIHRYIGDYTHNIFELCICQGCYYKYTYTKEEIKDIIKRDIIKDRHDDCCGDKCIEDRIIDHCLKQITYSGKNIELFIYLIFKKLESFNYDFNPEKYPFERFVDMIKEIDFKRNALSKGNDELLSSYGFNPKKMCDEEKALILNR